MEEQDYIPRLVTDDSGFDIVVNAQSKVCAKLLEEELKGHHKRVIKRVGPKTFFSTVYNLKPGSSAYDQLEAIEEEEWKHDALTKLTPQCTFGLFLTVSPDPEKTSAQVLFDYCAKVFSKTRVGYLAVTWCIEQSGGEGTNHPLGYHPHLHILVTLNKTSQSGEPRRMRNWLLKTFNPFNNCNASLQIKAVSNPGLEKKWEYVTGKKTDDKKASLVEQDKLWREQQGWKDYYEVSC